MPGAERYCTGKDRYSAVPVPVDTVPIPVLYEGTVMERYRPKQERHCPGSFNKRTGTNTGTRPDICTGQTPVFIGRIPVLFTGI